MKKMPLFKSLSTLMAALVLSFYAIAQDKKIDLTVTTEKSTSSDWYTQPWVWIAGGAVFVLILVALLRNNRNRA